MVNSGPPPVSWTRGLGCPRGEGKLLFVLGGCLVAQMEDLVAEEAVSLSRQMPIFPIEEKALAWMDQDKKAGLQWRWMLRKFACLRVRDEWQSFHSSKDCASSSRAFTTLLSARHGECGRAPLHPQPWRLVGGLAGSPTPDWYCWLDDTSGGSSGVPRARHPPAALRSEAHSR